MTGNRAEGLTRQSHKKACCNKQQADNTIFFTAPLRLCEKICTQRRKGAVGLCCFFDRYAVEDQSHRSKEQRTQDKITSLR